MRDRSIFEDRDRGADPPRVPGSSGSDAASSNGAGLLVLTRLPGESILIEDPRRPGDLIRVTMRHIGGQDVRLLFQAPPHVRIRRSEVDDGQPFGEEKGGGVLVLGRRAGQAVHIGAGARLVVPSVKSRRARIGLQAPPEVSFLRGKLDPHAPTDEMEGAA